jgi:hypothetical protein
MLGLWTRNFRRFLGALDGTGCPVCAVVEEAVARHLKKIAMRRSSQKRYLCGSHLGDLLDLVSDEALRVSAVQNALKASATRQASLRGGRCELCELSHRMTERLACAVAAMDGRIRFEKALQSGALVCCAHVSEITGAVHAERFQQIQHQKVQALIAEIGQSRLRQRADLDALISSAISYLGLAKRERTAPAPLGTQRARIDTDGLAAPVRAEFESWDEARRLAHLGDIESEVASLRYRNGVLSEENRRLKLAHTADDAMRRDLERDRRELIAAVNNSRSSRTPEKR